MSLACVCGCWGLWLRTIGWLLLLMKEERVAWWLCNGVRLVQMLASMLRCFVFPGRRSQATPNPTAAQIRHSQNSPNTPRNRQGTNVKTARASSE